MSSSDLSTITDPPTDVKVDEIMDGDETMDVKIDETMDVKVDETMDVKVDETMDVKVDETMDVKVDETMDVKVDDTMDVKVDETPQTTQTVAARAAVIPSPSEHLEREAKRIARITVTLGRGYVSTRTTSEYWSRDVGFRIRLLELRGAMRQTEEACEALKRSLKIFYGPAAKSAETVMKRWIENWAQLVEVIAEFNVRAKILDIPAPSVPHIFWSEVEQEQGSQ
ncbi:MAG: hypothetical protein Q9170_008118 [Blastenia crenularia]